MEELYALITSRQTRVIITQDFHDVKLPGKGNDGFIQNEVES